LLFNTKWENFQLYIIMRTSYIWRDDNEVQPLHHQCSHWNSNPRSTTWTCQPLYHQCSHWDSNPRSTAWACQPLYHQCSHWDSNPRSTAWARQPLYHQCSRHFFVISMEHDKYMIPWYFKYNIPLYGRQALWK
jgi:hypothetical protein